MLFKTSTKFLGVGRVLLFAPKHAKMATQPSRNINFNTKHLKKGDPLPPYNGILRVYNMRYCPYAQRTILALNAKGINYEVININLVEKPEWLPVKSAFAKVPALEISDGVSIYESLVTVEYLDDAYPQRPLLPKDPVTKAFDKIIVEAAGPIHTLFYKVIRFPDTVSEDNITAYHKALDFIQQQLQSRGTPFLDGAKPGYADYMIWPWFERILTLQKSDKTVEICSNKYKCLNEYLSRMHDDPAVSCYLIPDDVMNKFLDAYRAGKTPNYDYLLEK